MKPRYLDTLSTATIQLIVDSYREKRSLLKRLNPKDGEQLHQYELELKARKNRFAEKGVVTCQS